MSSIHPRPVRTSWYVGFLEAHPVFLEEKSVDSVGF